MFNPDADHKTTDQGVWEEFQGAEFLIAHTSSIRFQRALSRGQQPVRKKIENGTLDPAENKKIICRAMAEGLLLDWRKTPDFTGDLPAYTPDLGFNALMKQPQFRDFVSDFSMQLVNFTRVEVEEVGKD
jgi:hypothetical protein